VRSIFILRSVCCGVAAAVVSLWVEFWVLTWDAGRRVPESVRASIGPQGELGFDLLALMREHLGATGVWLGAAFAIGFLLGWRAFAKRSSPRSP
jgi:hypothetical protein